MQTYSVIGALELDSQVAELLPDKETLLVNLNVAPVVAVNMAFAINAATIGSTASAMALQGIGVSLG